MFAKPVAKINSTCAAENGLLEENLGESLSMYREIFVTPVERLKTFRKIIIVLIVLINCSMMNWMFFEDKGMKAVMYNLLWSFILVPLYISSLVILQELRGITKDSSPFLSETSKISECLEVHN